MALHLPEVARGQVERVELGRDVVQPAGYAFPEMEIIDDDHGVPGLCELLGEVFSAVALLAVLDEDRVVAPEIDDAVAPEEHRPAPGVEHHQGRDGILDAGGQ